MHPHAPFLDVRSFISDEAPIGQDALETAIAPISPFLPVYEAEEGGLTDPVAEGYAAFLNELYDEEFNEALFDKFFSPGHNVYITSPLN